MVDYCKDQSLSAAEYFDSLALGLISLNFWPSPHYACAYIGTTSHFVYTHTSVLSQSHIANFKMLTAGRLGWDSAVVVEMGKYV